MNGPASAGVRFAAIGIDHNHIHGQVKALTGAGAGFVAFFSREDALAASFAARYPQARRVDDAAAILEDRTIDLVVSAAIPDERAALGIAAMRAGKDFLADKPGMTTLAQLAEVRRVQAETGRLYGILFSEHHLSRSTVMAEQLVRQGAIGEVLQVTGLGPHRLAPATRAPWVFERECTGGILTDLGSHQVEQFLSFTGADDAQVASARTANLGHAAYPALQDFGEMLLRTPRASGYVRVDWFTPEGLPTWGDVRLMLLGTHGTIELRKNIDLAGAPGGDHLLLADAQGVRRIACDNVALPWAGAFLRDIRERGETAMPQARAFKAMEIALTAQALADNLSADPHA